MDEFQRRGTTFPVNIEAKNKKLQFFTLLDTGAIHSCINYNTFRKLNVSISQQEVPKVIGVDGSDLGSMGLVELTLNLGANKVKQNFIICRELRRNIILGVDFAKQNCAGIQWNTSRTHVLLLNGIKAVEVEEDELGIPVTASYHVTVPPRHNAVFEVNIHAEIEGTQVIFGNKQLLERHPNMYQHEISIVNDDKSKPFQLMVVTNLDQVKTLHFHKGEIVGFAKAESSEVTYIATTNELNIEETVDVVPINWLPKRKWDLKCLALTQTQGSSSERSKHSRKSRTAALSTEKWTHSMPEKDTIRTWRELTCESSDHSQDSLPECVTEKTDILPHKERGSMEISELVDSSQNSLKDQWCDISEVVESDFLISPGDIYPNRKVQLEDADIKNSTKLGFEEMCKQQHEAFSKNNKDIGRTQLIEIEIDTGDSLPVAQSPYTLSLKHYDWVRQEIETLEKAGVIERSLSRWASPVIVVPKKSVPDEPP